MEIDQLTDVPPAIEWFANIDNPQTRRAYENACAVSWLLPASISHTRTALTPDSVYRKWYSSI
ncbi:MAG: hypothetical protein M3Q16_11585 [Pseudomonadota bacterium]|nr:hypothetical protein [Pseudomonadota bacterium]